MTPPLSIPLTAIIVRDRARDESNHGDIAGLADSMKSIGSIHPIGLSQRKPQNEQEEKIAHEGYVYDLVVGGRRYKALLRRAKDAPESCSTLHHGSYLDPRKLGFLFASEVPEVKRKEAELDENLQRLDIGWQKNVLLVHEVHETKRALLGAKAHKWGEQQTASLLGPGYGKSSVNNALKLARLIRDGDKEILTCKTMSDALGLCLKRGEERALAELTKRLAPKAAVGSKPADLTSILSPLNVNIITTKGGDADAHARPLETNDRTGLVPPTPKVLSSGVGDVAPKVQVPLSSMFILADTMSYGWGSVDHIVTDIPYGIDMDNLDAKQIESVKAQHDVEQNLEMMPEFLRKAFDAVKPGGFCVFCYDLDHHEKLQAWALAVGWKVQRWPVIAAKSSACQNNAAQYNTTKNYEAIMYLRKSESSVLRRVVNSSVRTYNFAAERQLYNNPFAKPFELWKDIYEDISFVGQSVLDPFCGEMSACRAAANCGRIPYGIEINEKHYTKGLDHMRTVYNLIHANNVTFV